jgi:ketosteroid isomerase-like protein
MRRFLAASLAVGLLAGCFWVASAPGQSGDQELRVLVPKIVAAWGTLDIAKVEPYYAAEADFAYFDIMPMKYNNWAEYRAGVQKGLFESNTSITLKMNDDLRVHSQGRFAWATFTFGGDLTPKQGAAAHLDGRWTMILEKRAKGWIVVHEHVSVPMSGS